MAYKGPEVVVGAGSATDNALARYDGTSGSILQDSTVLVSDNGEMTNASQPAFLAVQGTTDNNETGASVLYLLGDTDVGTALTEIFDQNGDFTTGSSGGAFFTSPVDGRYFLQVNVGLAGLTSSHTIGLSDIVTSNRQYRIYEGSPYGAASASATFTYNGATLADMDAADTAYIEIQVQGGTQVVDIRGTVSTTELTWFSGSLIC